MNGKPNIGEYLDESTGQLAPRRQRTRPLLQPLHHRRPNNHRPKRPPPPRRQPPPHPPPNPHHRPKRLGLLRPRQHPLSQPHPLHPLGPHRPKIPQGSRPHPLLRLKNRRPIPEATTSYRNLAIKTVLGRAGAGAQLYAPYTKPRTRGELPSNPCTCGGSQDRKPLLVLPAPRMSPAVLAAHKTKFPHWPQPQSRRACFNTPTFLN